MHALVPRALGALGALATLATLALAAMPAHACSKSFGAWRSDATVSLLGVAAADTVLAGAGSVRFSIGPGHFGPAYGQARPIHGQAVEVRRLDERSRRLLPPETPRVVIVPWDYGPDCRPIPWANSFRWAAPGAEGLFAGELRDPAHWVDGVPTLDLHLPTAFPYTDASARARPAASPALTAAELLGLYEVAPTPTEQERDFSAAVAPIAAWARRNPDLARRWPADEMLRVLRYQSEQRRIRALVPPMGGTYRLTFALDDAPPRTLWMRSWDHPTHGEPSRQRAPRDPEADPLARDPSSAYDVLVVADTAPAALPDSADRYVGPRHGYLRIALDAVGESGPPPWRGEIEPDLVLRAFPSDSSLARFVRAAREEAFAAYRGGAARPDPATFALDADGTLRVEQRVTLADGRTLVIRGVRVSDAVVRDTRTP